MRRGSLLFLLLVDSVCLRDRVELFGFVLFTWVFFHLIIKTSVVSMAFPDAFLIADGDQFD